MPPPPRQNAQATRLSKPRQARAPQVLPVVFGALGQALGAPKTHEAAQFTGHLAGGNELGGLGNELELEIFERVTRGETGMHQSDVLFFGGGVSLSTCVLLVSFMEDNDLPNSGINWTLLLTRPPSRNCRTGSCPSSCMLL